tara:strand:+ start:703 stop:978 length:276 start_codon:yes stop_codon:yes gene_type:complete
LTVPIYIGYIQGETEAVRIITENPFQQPQSPMHYLFCTMDVQNALGQFELTTDIVWQYETLADAEDAADLYNSNLADRGIPSWTCCYYVGS